MSHWVYRLCYRISVIPEILYSPQLSIFLSLLFDLHNSHMKYVGEKTEVQNS